jgi:anti-sigma regulatory factor (Ser/Thr protein kinase)/CheY-like chemotaxis protein
MTRILLIDAGDEVAGWLRAEPALNGAVLDMAAGRVHALGRLRQHRYDAVVTSPAGSVDENLALMAEMRHLRPGLKVVMLAAHAAPEEILEALRAHVFAVFDAPFVPTEVADMVRRAVQEEADWRDRIEVTSATPDWVSLRLDCRVLTAERVVSFLDELRQGDLPENERADFMTAFREVLLNAMEHGGGFDPDQVVEVTAVRTARALVFHVRDPGRGFRMPELQHAAIAQPDGDPLELAERRAQAGLRPGGFGLLMARSVVDEMIHSETGNEVLLVKHTR